MVRNALPYLFYGVDDHKSLLLLLRVLDILPENGTTALISFVLAFHWMGVCCVIIATVTVASMVFDTVEEVELITKTRMEGTLLAARSFAQKACRASVRFPPVLFCR